MPDDMIPSPETVRKAEEAGLVFSEDRQGCIYGRRLRGAGQAGLPRFFKSSAGC